MSANAEGEGAVAARARSRLGVGGDREARRYHACARGGCGVDDRERSGTMWGCAMGGRQTSRGRTLYCSSAVS